MDRLLAPNRPSFRRPPDRAEIAEILSDPKEAKASPPPEVRVQTDAARSRIVLVVPRHGGPDADMLRRMVLAGTGAATRITSGADGGRRWAARQGPSGADCEALVEVLEWDDLPAGFLRTAIRSGVAALARTGWTYVSTGVLTRLWRLRREAAAAAAFRTAPLLLQLLAAGLTGLVGGLVLAGGLGTLSAVVGLPGWPAALLSTAAGASVAVFVLRLLRGGEAHLHAYEVLRGIAYLSSRRGAYPPDLEERLGQFSDRIGWALRQPVDEVVVVGQGEGAALAVSALADAVRWGELPDGAPALSLLTLGQTIPLIGFLPEASRLRADLRDVSLRDDICWVDVSDSADLHAFALSDPVAVCGVALDDRTGPLVLASSFGRRASGGLGTLLRDNGLNRRDRYFESRGEGARDYDWQRVLLGPLSFRKLLSGRPPAAGRIDVRGTAYASTARPRPEPDEDD